MLPLRGLSGLSVKIFEDMWLGALGVGAGTGTGTVPSLESGTTTCHVYTCSYIYSPRKRTCTRDDFGDHDHRPKGYPPVPVPVPNSGPLDLTVAVQWRVWPLLFVSFR